MKKFKNITEEEAVAALEENGNSYAAAEKALKYTAFREENLDDLFGRDSDEDALSRTGADGSPLVKDEPRGPGSSSGRVKQEQVDVPEDEDIAHMFGEAEEARSRCSAEDEEKDLFGELSDEESVHDETVEQYDVRKRLLPDGEVLVFKLPNTLAVDMDPFSEDTFEENIGFKEKMNAYERYTNYLCGPENTVRWRFVRDADGKIVYNESDEPQYESNAQFVEWDDGS